MVNVLEAVEIRERDQEGESPASIGIAIGISSRTVKDVLSGRIEPRPLNLREHAERLDRMGWQALCMTDEEWVLWKATNPPLSWNGGLAVWPCSDCPAGFAADMRAQGRCNGSPGAAAPLIELAARSVPPAAIAAQPAEEAAPMTDDRDPVEPLIEPEPVREPRSPAERAVHAELAELNAQIALLEDQHRAAQERTAKAIGDQAFISDHLDDCRFRAQSTHTALLALLRRRLVEPVAPMDVELAGDESGVDDPVADGQDEAAPDRDEADWIEGERTNSAPFAPDLSRLTRREREVLDAVAVAGSIPAAARRLKSGNETVNATLHRVARKGALPVDLIASLPASFARYATVQP